MVCSHVFFSCKQCMDSVKYILMCLVNKMLKTSSNSLFQFVQLPCVWCSTGPGFLLNFSERPRKGQNDNMFKDCNWFFFYNKTIQRRIFFKVVHINCLPSCHGDVARLDDFKVGLWVVTEAVGLMKLEYRLKETTQKLMSYLFTGSTLQ